MIVTFRRADGHQFEREVETPLPRVQYVQRLPRGPASFRQTDFLPSPPPPIVVYYLYRCTKGLPLYVESGSEHKWLKQ
jgi:hypothetical protein